MRVLLTGGHGLLGAAIHREFSGAADVHTFGHADLDISDDAAALRAVADVRPDVIINCAAYNDVDGAEADADEALRVNAFGVLALARAAKAAGAALVHYSTDFVFDGEADRPYTEEDCPHPRSVYATSKLLGDWLAEDAPRAYVLRVESLFGHPAPGRGPRGSVAAMVQRIRGGDEVPVFVDRTVSPGYTADIAWATRQLVERTAAPGLYHCVNTGSTSWAGIAEEVARLIGHPLRMKPLTLAAARLAAPRPRYCALANGKLAGAGIVMPSWQNALARYLQEPGGP
jgi:dTDP-4-dehydrorhamnose reductase